MSVHEYDSEIVEFAVVRAPLAPSHREASLSQFLDGFSGVVWKLVVGTGRFVAVDEFAERLRVRLLAVALEESAPGGVGDSAVALDEEDVEKVVGVFVAIARGVGVALERPNSLSGDDGMTERAAECPGGVFHSTSLHHRDGESLRAHVDADGAGGGLAGNGDADEHAGGVLVPGEDAERRGGGRRRDAGSLGALARDVASLPLR
jgi:hypothetical protein